MRLAVLADIHGNLRALEAVMADLRGFAPDGIVNLGDCLSGPLQARDTCDLLMTQGWPTVRGNHDRHLVTQSPAAMGLSDRAAYDQLGAAHLAWLAALPATLTLDGGLLLCHGTPRNDDAYLCESLTSGRPERADQDAVEAHLADTDAHVILCGHSHMPRLMQLRSGRAVFNPGSVGLQAYDDETPVPHVMAAGSPHARYGLMDWADGMWHFTHRAIAYDWTSASHHAAAAGRLEWAEALATGWIAP